MRKQLPLQGASPGSRQLLVLQALGGRGGGQPVCSREASVARSAPSREGPLPRLSTGPCPAYNYRPRERTWGLRPNWIKFTPVYVERAI